MRKAHAEFRAAKRRAPAWSFARCLGFAWSIARQQRARLKVAVPYVLIIAASKEVANMRLILIDNNSGLIFGDTANYLLARLNDWRENN